MWLQKLHPGERTHTEGDLHCTPLCARRFRLHRLSVLSWSTLTTAGSIDLDISFYVAAPPAPTSLTAALAAGVDELTLRVSCAYGGWCVAATLRSR